MHVEQNIIKKYFKTILTTGINRENGLITKDNPEWEKLNKSTMQIFELDEKRTRPPVFQPLHFQEKYQKNEDEETFFHDLLL